MPVYRVVFPLLRLESVDAGGVPATWHGERRLSERGTLLYLHGGAWCLHLPNAYRRFVTRLSRSTGMRVLLPDYRLAPEHPFPAGRRRLSRRLPLVSSTSGYAAEPLPLPATPPAAACRRDTDARAGCRGCRCPAAPCCCRRRPTSRCPAPRTSTTSGSTRCSRALATGLLPDLYCPGTERYHPWLSPLFGDWRGLPPLLFHAGSTEMLLDDSVRAHDRARAAGVDARLQRLAAACRTCSSCSAGMPEARRRCDEIAGVHPRAPRSAVRGAATIAAGRVNFAAIPDSYARSGA